MLLEILELPRIQKDPVARLTSLVADMRLRGFHHPRTANRAVDPRDPVPTRPDIGIPAVDPIRTLQKIGRE